MLKKTVFTLLIILFLIFLFFPIFIGGAILRYSPSDEHILDYVEDLIGQDMDAYDCEIIDRTFSTNVREYSLYVIVQINSEFDVSGFETDRAYPNQIQQLFHKAYDVDDIPQCCYYIASDHLSCVFDPGRNWLVLNWE